MLEFLGNRKYFLAKLYSLAFLEKIDKILRFILAFILFNNLKKNILKMNIGFKYKQGINSVKFTGKLFPDN